MLTMYPACIFKEPNGYSVIFPDLENGHLATCGNTLDEAISMAVDCLAGYVYISKELKEEIPEPTKLADIDIHKVAKSIYENTNDFSDAFVNIISVDVANYAKEHFEKSVKKTLTIPAWLNDLALERGINFSQVLQEALLTKIRM